MVRIVRDIRNYYPIVVAFCGSYNNATVNICNNSLGLAATVAQPEIFEPLRLVPCLGRLQGRPRSSFQHEQPTLTEGMKLLGATRVGTLTEHGSLPTSSSAELAPVDGQFPV